MLSSIHIATMKKYSNQSLTESTHSVGMYFLRYYTHLLILHWVGAWKNVNDFTQLKNESFCRLYLNRIFFSPFSL